VALVLDCVDRWGRRIYLTEACWFEHIVDGHPNLKDQLDRLHLVIENPTVVFHDAFHEDRESFYRRGIDFANPRLLTKISVQFHSPDGDGSIEGEITTIYPTSKVKGGEQKKWP
jgi:hypothetical protein